MSTAPIPLAPNSHSHWQAIFVGPGGIRAGWRLLIYIVIAALILVVMGALLGLLASTVAHPQPGFARRPVGLLWSEVSLAVAALGAAAVMARIEKRSFGSYGLPRTGLFGNYFWQGVAWGLAEISAVISLIGASHGYSFGTIALSPGAIVKYAALWGFIFLIVGLAEEFLFRGYTQFTLASGIGFWPAAVLLSIAFGAVHLFNKGEGPLGALSVVVIGLFFCLTLWRTGSLWFAVGMHASFDFGETFLYSVPNSGFVAEGHLSNATLHGPAWLTGGTVGPEGSVYSFATMALLFVTFARVYSARPNPARPDSPEAARPPEKGNEAGAIQ
ncbi:MAG TPA: type II CAAX endopeptidase family protein [Candidatus Dormibacteraeota bacterium]|nr:type II CAAX endopeptidase family protein [Candidatus Dormibacteraeota bacterium]